MKRPLAAVAIGAVLGVALAILLFGVRTTPPRRDGPAVAGAPAEAAGTPPSSPRPAAAAVSTGTNPVSVAAPAGVAGAARAAVPAAMAPVQADAGVPADLPPDIILQNLRRTVRQYGQTFGGNPVGTNPEITAALAGKNPKQINFLRGQPGLQINERGEMVDTWGTPYFFHQLSAKVMEIHSAGPDKVMWTSDDLVTE